MNPFSFNEWKIDLGLKVTFHRLPGVIHVRTINTEWSLNQDSQWGQYCGVSSMRAHALLTAICQF